MFIILGYSTKKCRLTSEVDSLFMKTLRCIVSERPELNDTELAPFDRLKSREPISIKSELEAKLQMNVVKYRMKILVDELIKKGLISPSLFCLSSLYQQQTIHVNKKMTALSLLCIVSSNPTVHFGF
jgi:hypothetical protein